MAGILLAGCHPLVILPLILLAASGAMVAVRCQSKPALSWVGIVALWIAVGALRTAQVGWQPPHAISRLVSDAPQPVIVRGIVADDPTEVAAPGEPRAQVVVLNVSHARLTDRWQPVAGRIRAKLREPRIALRYGDDVLIEGRWQAPPSPGNPGQFDWRAALARQGVTAILRVEPYHPVVRLQGGGGRFWLRGVMRLRRRMQAVIDASFPPERAGLVRSLVLGQRVALDESLKRAFAETGTIHLLVISGFNVGLIAALLELALRLFGAPFRPRLLLEAVCLLGYCGLTGLQPPVVRATVMAWVVLGALALQRPVNWPNTVAAAALVMLLWQPAQLEDPGFQLSFGAVVSLLIFTEPCRRVIEPLMPKLPDRLRRYLALSLASTLAVWIGLWPALAWYFHLIAPVSILANLLLVPLISMLVGTGTVIVLLGTIAPQLVQATAPAFGLGLDAAVGLVRACQQIPGGSWIVGQPSLALVAGYYALVLLTRLSSRWRLVPAHVAIAWLLAGNLAVWSGVAQTWRDSRWLEVTLLDVGHGDAIAARLPSGRWLLVDTGTPEAGRYVVVPFLQHHGVCRLDALVLTHPDADHVGGAEAVLQSARVRQLLTNGAIDDMPTYQHALQEAERRHVPIRTLAAGLRITDGANCWIDVLHPPASFVPNAAPGSNDNSVVLRLRFGDTSVLLTGDLEERGAPILLEQGSAIRADVLKVPHHGSALGPWSRRLFAQIHPELAVISVGRLHRLPAASILDDLRASGARVILTREAGAVTILMDGRRLVVRTFRQYNPKVPGTK